jgi:hypothetical protein
MHNIWQYREKEVDRFFSRAIEVCSWLPKEGLRQGLQAGIPSQQSQTDDRCWPFAHRHANLGPTTTEERDHEEEVRCQ